MKAYPLEDVKSPVTSNALREWMEYPCFSDGQTAAADSMLKSATESVINHIHREIRPRKRKVEIVHWPTFGTAAGGLRPRYREAVYPLRLPFGPIISIDSITTDGDSVDASEYDLDADLLFLDPADDTVIEYTAGYDDVIPESIRLAILTLATYLWHKRGEPVGHALFDSGAASMLVAYRDLTV